MKGIIQKNSKGCFQYKLEGTKRFIGTDKSFLDDAIFYIMKKLSVRLKELARFENTIIIEITEIEL